MGPIGVVEVDPVSTGELAALVGVHDLGRSLSSSRRGSSFEPLRQKIVLHRQPPDLGVQVLDLGLRGAALGGAGFVAPQGFKYNLRFELIRKIPSFRHLVSLFQVRDTP